MLDQTNSPITQFVEHNQQEFAELLTFIDFAAGLTIGFIQINQEKDKSTLAAALRQHLSADVHLEVMDFSQERELRFLQDALKQRLGRIKVEQKQKLVVLIQGLEVAIGTDAVGKYPPILRDLNFMRDAYRQSVPHPLLFVLPDYAITRVSLYAPDFWAWKSGLFCFNTAEAQVQQLKVEAFEQPLARIASTENQAQIDQLKQLLMELRPSGKPIAPQDLHLCSEVYYKIGSAYLTQQQPEKAKDYLQEGLKVMAKEPDPLLQQSLYRKLGNAYEQLRQFEAAVTAYQQALEIARSLDQSDRVATVIHDLGDIALARRQFEQAKDFYDQSLTIDETRGDRYFQAFTYHQLGIVAQALRKFEQARDNYQQALQIKAEFGDRYSQASTHHQLGRVAQELREYEQARAHYQQALQIYVEFGDRYSQARTYNQLGLLAEAEGNLVEARAALQQAMAIFTEFGDEYSMAIVQRNLDRLSG
jgi:tetratricopeptide (TPR) repeat protein